MSDTVIKSQLNQQVKKQQLKHKQPESLLSGLYANAMKASPFGISIYNSSGDCIAANEVIGSIIGATKEQVLQQNYHQIESWKKSGLYANALKAIKKNKNQYHDGVITTTFGITNYYGIHLIPFSDEKEQYLMLITDEINESKQAVEKLLLSNNRFSTIMDSLDAWVYVIDFDTYEVLFINKSIRDSFGELKGKTCWKSLQTGMTGPCEFCTNQYLVDDKGRATGVYQWEFQNTVTGRWYDCKDQAISWHDGRLVRMETAIDITEEKQLEEAKQKNEQSLNIAQNTANIGSWDWNIKQNTLSWSNQTFIQFGLKPGEVEPSYEIFEKFIHPEDRENLNNEVEKALSGENAYSVEARMIRTDGTEWIMLAKGIVYRDDEGNPIQFIGTQQDITEHKLAENELFKARKLESVGVLAGGIAHDFNNILTELFGNIELAKIKLSQEHRAYYNLQAASNAMERATNLTSQLLTFAKGGEPLMKSIHVAQLLKDSVKLSMSGSNVQIIWDIDDDLWLINADIGQLSQVITNIVINAVQAMPTGGTLTVEASNINDSKITTYHKLPEKCVRITISDNGIGIQKEHLEHIYDPYYSTKKTAHGLGLATAYSIIAKHNGKILVDSKLERGTRFSIYLPADMSSSEVIREVPMNDQKDSESETTTANILVMDDNEMILKMATEMLEVLDHKVETAVDGNDAIRKYTEASKSSTPFDVVIMDLTIPGGMGGKEAVQELLAFDADAKVIVSSGYSSDPIMANYTEYGFKGILTKPYQLNSLEKELSRLIN